MCGTTEYMSPEIVAGSGHDRATDWWSLGILIYEMLVGCPPWSGHDGHIFERILRGEIEWSDTMDPLAKDLIEKLLMKDRFNRLGTVGGAQAIKRHPWFAGVDWNEIAERKYPGPIVPDMTKEGHSYFESREEPLEQDPRINYEELFASF
jgi:serine/threonine protein kinase